METDLGVMGLRMAPRLLVLRSSAEVEESAPDPAAGARPAHPRPGPCGHYNCEGRDWVV